MRALLLLAGFLLSAPAIAEERASCYVTANKSLVCWMHVEDSLYSVSINHKQAEAIDGAQVPSLLLIDCDEGYYRARGIISQENASLLANAFCSETIEEQPAPKAV